MFDCRYCLVRKRNRRVGYRQKNRNVPKRKYHFGEVYAPVKFGEYQSCFDSASTIHVGFYVDWNENHDFRKDLGYWIKMVDAEVVGNIFDNPELLEEEGN